MKHFAFLALSGDTCPRDDTPIEPGGITWHTAKYGTRAQPAPVHLRWWTVCLRGDGLSLPRGRARRMPGAMPVRSCNPSATRPAPRQ